MIAGVHLPVEVAQQRDRVDQSPPSAHHWKEHDRDALYRRLPHFHQAPWPRENALGREDEEHVGLVHAPCEERAQINQVSRVEVSVAARHPLDQIIERPTGWLSRIQVFFA